MTGIHMKSGLILFLLLSACSNPEPESVGITQAVAGTSDDAEQVSLVSVSKPLAAADAETKPYQVVDGKISENTLEGWKTYNGGGCGTCHGKGGIGAVGPNLADSLKSKISKDSFYELVKNGKPGTMMRPNNTNKRVIDNLDNLDNLYAYLLARSDGVLGPENLIKFPLGKNE
ncbi:MAG: hypothetical protein GKR93_04565 [Gammaproteobacteria bacterium]|nr:hypothetical protein [Gammaproteobacteria bacterium]